MHLPFLAWVALNSKKIFFYKVKDEAKPMSEMVEIVLIAPNQVLQSTLVGSGDERLRCG